MFTEHPPYLFRTILDHVRRLDSRIADATSTFDHVEGTRYFLDDEEMTGIVGYAIRPDGELVYVFSTVPGQGAAIVESALANGAVYLDCFEGYLPTFYGRHGFVEVSRVANWTPGEPDVVYMSLPGFESRHGVTA